MASAGTSDLAQKSVSDALRATVRRELQPELDEIGSETLRDQVVEAWAVAIAHTSFTCIGDLRASGMWHSDRLIRGTQADHLRGVAAIALQIAAVLKRQFPELPVDRDILVAGALCHDVGKPYEYDPEKRAQRKAQPSRAGWPLFRHPPYGMHVCLTVGLPDEVAQIALGHSYEGEVLARSPECTIVHYADKSYWQTLRISGLMIDDYTDEVGA
ncbi:HD domain-containing protein [Aquabacter spiritensis]|uniref:Putative nucleotidyltransferase with HDIG domain n=1 Tax=Aquabacter spiritensis TaxID=933073 RepID=A0A4R3M1B1_9HYPH|nr:HD domain-containing protein [Aquabacter spiritensis]TCT06782.1 putative nucleotidyltransferase with HDIG domain [Aquabacter spiritensis]